MAGPIVRADYFLPQLDKNEVPTSENVWGGLWLVIVGVIKKAVIADYIAQYNDLIFNDPSLYTGVQTLMGVLGYTMQIYCDFSGYSDMAIGLALIMGFRLGLNFDSPYQSRNLTEFWRRWHISLSSWLRDYVYIPLGGNRKGTFRTYLNNFLTMLIGGLWHGAAWSHRELHPYRKAQLSGIREGVRPPNKTLWLRRELIYLSSLECFVCRNVEKTFLFEK